MNDAFTDGGLPFKATFHRDSRAITFEPVAIDKADRVVCRIEDIAQTIQLKEGSTSWP